VIHNLFLWSSRGVSGVAQGVSFIGTGLVKVGPDVINENLEEAYATLGVDGADSLDEIGAVYRAKVKFNHPDGVQDANERRQREQRTGRLNEAWGVIQKARGAKS
jgi:DnaJ-class molecular chaperone